MYKPRARGIGILPYALPGVTGLVIGLSVFWFRLLPLAATFNYGRPVLADSNIFIM